MSIVLSDDEKRQLIGNRLRAFAVDSFGHELNKQVAIAANDTQAEAIANQAIAAIAVAAATYQAELDTLPVAVIETLPPEDEIVASVDDGLGSPSDPPPIAEVDASTMNASSDAPSN